MKCHTFHVSIFMPHQPNYSSTFARPKKGRPTKGFSISVGVTVHLSVCGLSIGSSVFHLWSSFIPWTPKI